MADANPLSLPLEDERSTALLEGRAALALDVAKEFGASSAESNVSRSQGMSVSVRTGDVETVEHNRDKSLVVSVYFDNRVGSASTSDFSDAAVRDTVRAACTIAKQTAGDPAIGLADAELMATEDIDLSLYHPWDVSMDEAIEIATRCEATALAADKRLTNTEGASVSSHEGSGVYANSHGFVGTQTGSRHSISCSVIGEDEGGMQRDYWYTSARAAEDLDDAEEIGRVAAARTVRRLGGRQLSTRTAPVLFEAPVAKSLIGHFLGGIRGSALYKKASFLLDSQGEKIWADGIRIHERPHLPKGSGSSAWDSEGVATRPRDIVTDGVVQGYVLSSYSARKLGLQTTANGGGVRNVTIDSGDDDFEGMLKRMGTGLLVTELIGFGVNNVTGDYSRGAAGFWVENGEISHPVEEITIAGDLKTMFAGVTAVGNDVDARGNTHTGSILINELTIAGS